MVLLGKMENKGSSLHYVFIHPALGTGRPGTASSTPGLALLISPAQEPRQLPPARIGMLRTMGTESSARPAGVCWDLGELSPAG